MYINKTNYSATAFEIISLHYFIDFYAFKLWKARLAGNMVKPQNGYHAIIASETALKLVYEIRI